MAACELARIAPDPSLVRPLMRFIEDRIEGYETFQELVGTPQERCSIRWRLAEIQAWINQGCPPWNELNAKQHEGAPE